MVIAVECLFIPNPKNTEKQIVANIINEFHETLLLTQRYNASVPQEDKITLDTIFEYFEITFKDFLKPKDLQCLLKNRLKSLQ